MTEDWRELPPRPSGGHRREDFPPLEETPFAFSGEPEPLVGDLAYDDPRTLGYGEPQDLGYAAQGASAGRHEQARHGQVRQEQGQAAPNEDPFRFSRAHSWPEAGPVIEPPQVLQPKYGRIAAAGAGGLVVVLLLVFAGRALVGLGESEPVAVVTASPTSQPSSIPEPSGRVVPPGQTPSGSTSTRTASPASAVLVPGDLAAVAPRRWGVSSTANTVAAHPLLSCDSTKQLPSVLRREFKVPFTPGPFADAPVITERVIQGAGTAATVQTFRQTLASCPTRGTGDTAEQWSIRQDSGSQNRDVFVVKREIGATVTEFLVVRVGALLTVTDYLLANDPNGKPDEQTDVLLAAISQRMCGSSAC